ncbi:hypothetical protein Mkiyose1665_14140 [Mycobacterium kiyosense]|uniref:FAD-binding domain-containing protein n=1 Tax=Mycobacterium kiyosense TaxID=2871094 RepID=A0A9P3UZS4_9MYCO|nr:hypothetical protein MKCMC460_04520 [Mycobacterium sp. 20KCMC460]GLB81870.1 hypothetical protein SRL2020028_11260 [Mycobacterium kiyosense]GLB88170.1 hypothetical protein SRL2020130_09870 [Mycobacterium kiyosense]GLB95730.1 hypothetical protein SRL2020226_25060 [Mycobacterium kiyosense]GLC01207.1 hypothetical protein SRL2020400_17980 [Mycobacterium kiyosense]
MIIVGAGPTGLMLAGELALAGVDVAVVERRANQELVESRAGGLHSRSLEILDQRGIVDRFLSVGQVSQLAGYAQIRLEIGDLPTPHPYGLALWQREIERILAEWVDELAVPIRRGSDVTGVAQHGTGVDVRLCDGTMLRAQYVVGCDGGRSAIRRAAGIEFPGWDPTTSYLIAEAELAPGAQPPWGIHRDALGIHALSRTGDAGPARIMVTEPRIGASSGPTLADLREGLVAVFGSDYGIHSIRWISRFSDLARQAAAYRDERILLAGDAAHVHHPIGGQGLNTGLQDAVNLGWKLAQVVNGVASDTLLDTYHSERHPVAARVLRNAVAQMALLRQDDRTRAVYDTVSDLLSIDQARKQFGAMMSGLDIRYDLGEGHPLLGRRMPDLELRTGGGRTRLFTLLHDARPVLLNLGDPGEVGQASHRVRLVHAKSDVNCELPVLGRVESPTAVLIRPDGHVAWVGMGSDRGLVAAVSRWFGTG